MKKKMFLDYILKEVEEQAVSIRATLAGRIMLDEGNVKLSGLDSISNRLRSLDNLYIIGRGTAYHAGLVGEYLFEEFSGVRTKAIVTSEFKNRKPVINRNSALLTISRSSETKDTIEAIRYAKTRGILSIGITNELNSTQVRETDIGIYTRCGSEIGVSSTKAFTSQLATMILMVLFLGRQRQLSSTVGQCITRELIRLPDMIDQTLSLETQVKYIAEKYQYCENFYYLGRKYNYPIALEGALKLKEIAHVHAEGTIGGELKHGGLALISDRHPSICVVPSDSVCNKMMSNIQEIKARKGPIIAIASEDNREIEGLVDDVVYIPLTLECINPILSIIPLQLFAYHFAKVRHYEIDKQKNLAGAIPVE